MATIVIQLDPTRLANPDLDIRYMLPDLLVARSGGRLREDGYDYFGEGLESLMQVYLTTEDAAAALPGVIHVLRTERVLGNDLSEVAVAVEDEEGFRVVHPPGFAGVFPQPGEGG